MGLVPDQILRSLPLAFPEVAFAELAQMSGPLATHCQLTVSLVCHGRYYSNAANPVTSLPVISRWMSCVPS